jgi:hypothetical protein
MRARKATNRGVEGTLKRYSRGSDKGCSGGSVREGVGVSKGDRDDLRRARVEVLSIEERRVRLSERVMRGDAEALEEDRRLEQRLRELANWLMSVEQQDEGFGAS